MIDLRSDTVTQPTEAMRMAMAEAPLGDDVYGEDPTVNALEALGAELLGKDASLFVPSGTMGNLIALLVHAPRGSEVILGDECHIYHYEQGGASAVGGLVMHPVPTGLDGGLALDDLERAIRPRGDVHSAWPGVICLENTHNRRGGAVLDLPYLVSVRDLADSHQIPLHLDGARLANAAVTTGRSMAQLAGPFHSVQLDLSKALGAPVGGLVAGSHSFVLQARRMRKLLGGGMRQAGVIAAAGIVALSEMVDRLAEDHQRARNLAEGLERIDGVEVDRTRVPSNLVLFRLKQGSNSAFLALMKERGVLLGEIGSGNLRMVTHYGISDDAIATTIETVRALLS